MTADRPRFSLVVVGGPDQAGDLVASLGEQADLAEVIVVDGPRAEARNKGIAAATGQWVAFPDAADALAPGYLAAVVAFLEAHPETTMVATARRRWDPATGEARNNHPLERFFTYDRPVDLAVARTLFHDSASAAFFDLDRIREHGLRFDAALPDGYDGPFVADYLLTTVSDRPLVGFVASAHYHQRITTAGDRRWPALVERYAALIAGLGKVPHWLRQLIGYDLTGLLAAYDRAELPSLDGPAADRLHEQLAAITGRIGIGEVLDRAEFRVARQHRLALEHGYASADWHEEQLRVDRVDDAQRLARARYFLTGVPPEETVWNGEQPAGPRHAKTCAYEYAGRVLLRERVLWVRYSPDLRVSVGGDPLPVVFAENQPAQPRVLPRQVRRHADARPEPPEPPQRRWGRDRPSPYQDAWVLMDRIHDAGDSGEILFRRLRSHHPEINAWFTVEEGTPDWTRLRAEFGDRVLAHGSPAWEEAMGHCVRLLSSHADQPIVRPRQIESPRWRFVFLQHGVIKDDLSSWLGPKRIDLFVTSTPQEQASVAGDESRYPFTTRESRLTGLPRFDRLRETGLRYPPPERDLVLVTPTWRRWLVDPLGRDDQRRSLRDSVADSEFVRSWLAFLRDPGLAAACAGHGVRLMLLPHPNLEAMLPRLDLPGHVEAASYSGTDVQELFARSRVLVTDYSSIAFNAAYLDRPVVYFQFDSDEVLGGGHVGRGGYFSYERDGFGPVLAGATEAAAATVEALTGGPDPAPEYAARIAATFPVRDGGCCERVIEAVRALDDPDDAEGQVPTPRR